MSFLLSHTFLSRNDLSQLRGNGRPAKIPGFPAHALHDRARRRRPLGAVQTPLRFGRRRHSVGNSPALAPPDSVWFPKFMVNRNLIREFDVSEDDWSAAIGELAPDDVSW